jgi:cytochrome c-type biogenesis protein CcmH
LEIFGPDPARLDDLGEAIIMASNGVVTPEAKNLFERANAANPDDVMAQYYLGLSAKQEGRRDEAVQRWTALISSARDGAEWLPLVKNALARVDEKGPPAAVAPPAAAAAPKGPSASQVAAAAEMAPDERKGMIEGMVARLAQKMAENGSDVDGWLRLIKAYAVLGERDKALAATANARSALSGNSDNLRRIGDLARELGLEGS